MIAKDNYITSFVFPPDNAAYHLMHCTILPDNLFFCKDTEV